MGDSRKYPYHTTLAASWNFEEEEGFLGLEGIGGGGGVINTVSNSKRMGGFSSDFPEGKIAKA